MKPGISIIVPIYNVEKYLQRCIDSILKQTFKDFELILVDDGSPDKCGEICDEYKKKDSRVRVIHKENGGLSDARNAGLDIAKGDYIGFVDSDDFINKNMYQVLYEAIINTRAEVSQCKFKYFSNESEIKEINYGDEEYKLYRNTEAIESVIENEILNVNVWNKLYSRHLFKDIRFPKGKIHEDEFVTYKLFFYSNRICYVNKELYYYFNNSQGIMRSNSILKKLDWIEAIEERNEFLLNTAEIDLYNRSNKNLFFNLVKYKYILKNNNYINDNGKYIKLIDDKVNKLIINMKNNNQISLKHKIVIRLANINKIFLNLYSIKN